MSNHSVPTSVPQPTNTHRETTQRGIYTQPRDKVQTHACQRHRDAKHKQYYRHMYRIDESVRINTSISELVTNSEHHSTSTKLRIMQPCDKTGTTRSEPNTSNTTSNPSESSQQRKVNPTAIIRPNGALNTPEILNPS